MKMELDEAIQKLKQAGLIVEGDMSLDAKLANAKRFNAVDEHGDIVTAYKAIKAMAGKGGWDFEEDSNPDEDFFTLEELTNGTLERVIKQNKGFYTIILDLRKTLNRFNDFAEIRLVVTPHGNPEIVVIKNDKDAKRFDVTEYPTAIEVAKNWTR